MTPWKPTEKQKKELRGLIEKWRPRLYLHQWDVTLHYMDSDDEVKTAIKTHMEPRYFSAAWSIYPAHFEQDKHKREEIVVHELIHCVTAKFARLVENASNGMIVTGERLDEVKEEVTQHFTNCIFNNHL